MSPVYTIQREGLGVGEVANTSPSGTFPLTLTLSRKGRGNLSPVARSYRKSRCLIAS